MLGLNVRGAKLAGLIPCKKYDATCLFCIAFEHIPPTKTCCLCRISSHSARYPSLEGSFANCRCLHPLPPLSTYLKTGPVKSGLWSGRFRIHPAYPGSLLPFLPVVLDPPIPPADLVHQLGLFRVVKPGYIAVQAPYCASR